MFNGVLLINVVYLRFKTSQAVSPHLILSKGEGFNFALFRTLSFGEGRVRPRAVNEDSDVQR
jgi:hypothetical protein